MPAAFLMVVPRRMAFTLNHKGAFTVERSTTESIVSVSPQFWAVNGDRECCAPALNGEHMPSTFCPDQIDAHRLLVQISTGRASASYKDNQKIFNQGEDADFVLFVQEGRVKLSATSEHGLETLLGIAQHGQFFGEACLHNVPVRMATATNR
jgi:Cyclic nucleotide-binding domain